MREGGYDPETFPYLLVGEFEAASADGGSTHAPKRKHDPSDEAFQYHSGKCTKAVLGQPTKREDGRVTLYLCPVGGLGEEKNLYMFFVKQTDQ
jgi:hypothetical protein